MPAEEKPKRKLTTDERVKLLEATVKEQATTIADLLDRIETLQFVRRNGDHRID
jgi:uncharacterized coiled-coil protein SlyX